MKQVRKNDGVERNGMMGSQRSLLRRVVSFLAILAVGFLGVYFRTYVIHGGPLFQFASLRARAETVVKKRMSDQVAKNMAQEIAHLPGEEKEMKLAPLVEKAAQENPAQFNATVQKVMQLIDGPRSWSWRSKYLLETDPYHYLYQTKQVLTTGKSGPEIKAGKVLNPMGRAPYGSWEPFLLHPYAGAVFYKGLRLFFPDIRVAEALAYWPLLMVLLVPFAYALFSRAVGLDFFSSLFGMLTITLAPVFILRTLYGWFDTDAYSYLFPFGIFAFILLPLKNGKHVFPCAAGASLLTGLYALSWPGWPLIPALTSGCLIGTGAVLTWMNRLKPPAIVMTALKTLGWYWLGVGLFMVLFMGLSGFLESLRLAWAVAVQFGLAKFEIWPKIFATVGEAKAVKLLPMINSAGNFAVFGLAFLGVVLETWRAFLKGDIKDRFRVLFFAMLAVPILLLSLQAVRFTVLFVMPLAIFASFGISNLLRMVSGVKDGGGKAGGRSQFRRVKLAVSALILLFVFDKQIQSADLAARRQPTIMNDVWYNACRELGQRSPPNAIVNAWWDPGYFFNEIANRRVLLDGGIQDSRVTYWLSVALFTEDETLSAGILRMINTSRNDAMEFLMGFGMRASVAVDLIRKIVVLNRHQAFLALPSGMPDPLKNEFLDKTHGRGPPPVYVVLDDDLVKKNSLVTSYARWDFDKAEALRYRPKPAFWERLGNNALEAYAKDLFYVAGKVIPYDLELPLVRTDGNVFVFGKRPFVVVNWAEKNALLLDATNKKVGKPASLFVLDDQNRLIEKKYEDFRYNGSVLVFRDGDKPYADLAEAPLIRSMLFRLYYLNAKGLKFFKPVVSKGSIGGGPCIRIFELDRSKFRD